MSNPLGMKPLPRTNEDMLRELANRSGGIPDFAKAALSNAGMNKALIDQIDADVRTPKKP